MVVLTFKYCWKVYKAAWEVSRGPILSIEWKDLDLVKKECTAKWTVLVLIELGPLPGIVAYSKPRLKPILSSKLLTYVIIHSYYSLSPSLLA